MDLHDGDITIEPEAHLTALGERFMEAIEQVELGRPDQAAEIFQQILKVEPRLAEPRIELARLTLDAGQLEEAEEQAREAILSLEAGGAWNKDLPEEVIKSAAYGLLGEILRLRSQSDEVVFADEEGARLKDLTAQAAACFKMAAQLDPENEHAAYYSFHLNLEGGSEGDEDEPF